MLEDGKPLHEVKKLVEEQLQGKCVVTVAGGTDFKALQLTAADFDHFDLQNVFKKWNGQTTRGGFKIYQPISLRDLCYHYFREDIQEGKHSSLTDAQNTMKVFRDIFIPFAKTNNYLTRSIPTTDEFEAIQKLT